MRERGRSSWHTCPCCVGNIPRTLLMVPTWTYAKAPDGVYVNLFIGSTITLENAGGTDVEMVQETDYPWSGKVADHGEPEDAEALRRAPPRPEPRRPASSTRRAPEVNGIVSLAVNGKTVKPVIEQGLRRDHARRGRRATRSSWSCR